MEALRPRSPSALLSSRTRTAAPVRLVRAHGRALALLCLLLALGFSAIPAHAHLRLENSSPAAGDTLRAAPAALRLGFSQPVELEFSRLRLLGPSGEVALGPMARAPESALRLQADIVGPLRAGRYTVQWQTASADGHPIRGEFSFDIAADAAGLPRDADPVAPVSSASAEVEREAGEETRWGAESAPFAAVRWGTFVALLAVIGTAMFRLLVLGRMPGAGDVAARAAPVAARAGLWAAALLLVALLLRLYAQSHAVFGPEPQPGRVLAMLRGTVWGWGWMAQAAGTLLALAGLLLARRGAEGGWLLAALGAAVLSFTPALSGHAAAAEHLRMAALVADGLHVLGAGGWLGTLLVLLVAGLPAAAALERGRRGPAAAELVQAFSPVALAFAGVVVLTGAFSTWLHVGSVDALVGSDYGRTLLLKLSVLSVVFATGWYNWRRVRPALGEEAVAGRLRRSASVELAAALLVLAVTAVLVSTPPPSRPVDPPAAGP